MHPTNNATRLLDAKKIHYTAHEVPAVKMSALEVADYLHIPAEKVYKTIVFQRDKKGKPILAVVPATGEVDPKKLAVVLGEKKVNPATMRDAERITGLLAGGISPLALINKGFEVVLDAGALEQEKICISGGQRGLQVQLRPMDVITLTSAKTALISK
jgi:Cys-tRNA(Pro)/Cys-tRNA(Cys) deacylase